LTRQQQQHSFDVAIKIVVISSTAAIAEKTGKYKFNQ
jgi:hypothetical protein